MWSFLQPLFLWAAAAAVVPLILHLMRRRRSVRMRFSTIRFLRLAQKRSASRIRMENLLLWLLRTLLILTVAAAFAAPVIQTEQWARLGLSRRDVALILDVSYSMGYESGRGCVGDEARDAAAAVVNGLQSGDRCCVFLAGEQPVALIRKPTSDLGMAANLIRQVRPVTGSSRLREAFAAAHAALAESKHRDREIHVFTDGQALPWSGFGAGGTGEGHTNASAIWDPATLDRRIAHFVVLAGPERPENTWPFQVDISPRVLTTNTAATATVRLGRTGPAQDLTVSLHLDGREATRRMAAVAGDGAVDVSLPLPPLAPGVHEARLEIPPDALAADDAFHFLVRVRESLPSLCVGPDGESSFVRTALNPAGDGSGVSVRRVDPGDLRQVTLRDFSSVFLVSALPLPGQDMLALEDYVREGGVLTIFPGDAVPGPYADWTILPAKPEAVVERLPDDRIRSLRLVRQREPLFADFVLPPGAIPTLAIQRHLRFGRLEPDAFPVIAAGSDIPFLLSRSVGRGRVLLCAVSADRRWSTLPVTSFFLPMLHQIVQFGAGVNREPLFHVTAPALLLSDVIPEMTERDRLLSPAGIPLTVRPVRQEGGIRLEAEDVTLPGVYVLMRPDGSRRPGFAANMDRAESNLQPVDPSSLARLTGLRNLRVARSGEELMRLIRDHRRGRPLTELCLWAALLLAVAEWYLANRASRPPRPLSETIRVGDSGRVLSGTPS